MHGMVEIHWYSSGSTLLARMRIKQSVAATIVYGLSFSSWVQVVTTILYESKLWSHDRVHK